LFEFRADIEAGPRILGAMLELGQFVGDQETSRIY